MIWERVLKLWAKEYREGLDERIQDLIGMAHCDLWYGPHRAEDYAEEDPSRKTKWPGFETACEEIRVALDVDMPSELWVDTSTEECHETAPPETEPCYECDGTGEINGEECDLCRGEGQIEAFLEDWVHVDRRKDILRAVVGKDLADYI